ncbi:MAG: hypothetical protein K2G55_21700 [Lachnospiraceae bacterium]|nr:hypothetical protein [Lachnospiraceae bacterium]MDE7202599.1 hypothetical protein [Lachnospiraceae bacterium]
MFTVTILDKSKKQLRTYKHITKIVYNNFIEEVVLEGDEILSHPFALTAPLHLYSDSGNYVISNDIIGTLEVEKES